MRGLFLYWLMQVGRFALAGPIVAAACVIPPGVLIQGMYGADKLNATERDVLYDALTTTPGVEWSVGIVDNVECDTLETPARVRCRCLVLHVMLSLADL